VSRNNVQMNCEGYISLRPGRWGMTFNSKFLSHNPYGFNLVQVDATVDHLQFTRAASSLIAKLNHTYWTECGMGINHVLTGDESYPVEYQELKSIAPAYAAHAEYLRRFVS